MTIKSYPKSELAQLYFPDSDPHVATNHLAQWIKRCPPLVAALAKTIFIRKNVVSFTFGEVTPVRK